MEDSGQLHDMVALLVEKSGGYQLERRLVEPQGTCRRNVISAIKFREGDGGVSFTDKIHLRNPRRERHHLEVLTLDLREMVRRPMDSTDLG